jgi:hypothetical protein
MSNKASKGLSEARRRFTEDVARLLVPWGVPQAPARTTSFVGIIFRRVRDEIRDYLKAFPS